MTKISDFIASLTSKERNELIRELGISLKKPIVKKVKPAIVKLKHGKILISRRKLSRLVHQNYTDKQLAEVFNVSERTISRRIKEYNLKGRPFKKKPLDFILTTDYIAQLKRDYSGLIVHRMPSKTFINSVDHILSNEKKYPKGKFFACCVYFVLQYEDGSYYVKMYSFRYRDQPVPYEEIRDWILKYADEMVAHMWENSLFIFIKNIAFDFLNKKEHLAVPPKYRGKQR